MTRFGSRSLLGLLLLQAALVAGPADEVQFRTRFGHAVRLRRSPISGHVQDLYGRALDLGVRPLSDADFAAAARQFVDAYRELFGTAAAELARARVTRLDLARIGASRKVGVEFAQEVEGIPVHGGSLCVLFDQDGRLLAVQNQTLADAAAAGTQPSISLATAIELAVQAFARPIDAVLSVELAIAGDERERATLAYLVEIRSTTLEQQMPAQERIAIDAHSGRVVARERTVHGTDLTGNVSGYASAGVLPDEPSNPATLQSLMLAHGTSAAGNADSDQSGNFVIPNSGGTPVDVTFDFGADSPYVYVTDQKGAELTLTQSVTPGVPSQFIFNPGTLEDDTAELNGHISVIKSRQFVKDVDPADPAVDFRARVLVNESGSCNAYYDGSSIHFYRQGSGCPNMAYSTIVSHELGHWYNDRYGSGNGSDGFGEGNADAWALYVHDDSCSGRDVYGPGTCGRDGENRKKYDGSCGGGCSEVHECGKVLMGVLWKVRRNLDNSLGDAQGDLVADSLYVRWMQGYNDKSICDVIETHWLTLDDTDGNLDNGTPHFGEIDSAFREQGFPGYSLPHDCTTPVNYGNGSPGGYGLVPHITSFNDPQIGTADFTVRGELTESGIPGFLAIGFAPAAIPYSDVTILVDIMRPYLAVSVATTGLPLPGQGSCEVPLPIPNDLGLDGLRFFGQFLFYDARAKWGVSATEGLDGTICCGC
ncbi:MAG: hypothetical protein U1E76_22270 [Planctomycetota bacterium]